MVRPGLNWPLMIWSMNYSRDLTGAAFHPGFRPQLRPKQMLKMGIFGGTYFARRPQDWRQLPADWRKGIEQLLPEKHYDPQRNCFKVRAGLAYREWKSNGWLRGCDPLGWFQWYCRYTLGRRCDDDERQIKRWRSYRRHIGMLVQVCRRREARLDDASVAPVSRQALLHWAYDPYLKELAGPSMREDRVR
jgi:hypothetical protein